jgi:hypothetical protein
MSFLHPIECVMLPVLDPDPVAKSPIRTPGGQAVGQETSATERQALQGHR